MNPVLGFAGMTHLGLNSAVASAALGCSVCAYDADRDHIARLRSGIPHVTEPDLERLMAEHAQRLNWSHDLAELAVCPLVVIAPDVPTDDQGHSDLNPLRNLIAAVDAVMPAEAVLVILSQVPPGFCRGLRLSPQRILYYQVETLIFGQAISRALHPERFIVGCSQPSHPLPVVYRHYLELFNCPILPMRYESAELAKISINCCLVASVSIANTLAELCESIGADWSEIVPALKKDKRIGPFAYLAPGLGIAGGNLERDLHTVVQMADRFGCDAQVVRAWIHNSAYRKHWVLRMLHQTVFPHNDDPRFAIWGLAYKQDTHSTKNSPALALLDHLGAYRVRAFDPVVRASSLTHYRIEEAASALAACEEADVLVIMTPWPAFSAVPLDAILRRLKGRVIIDPYKVLGSPHVPGLTHLSLGTPVTEDEQA